MTLEAIGRLSGTINRDSTIGSGADTVTGDLTIAPGAIVTLTAPLILWISAHSDDQHSGLDPNRVEVNVQGVLKARGTSSARIIWKSTNAVSPSRADWVGVRVWKQAKTELFYNDFRNAESAVTDSSRVGNDSIWGCIFEGNTIGLTLEHPSQDTTDTIAFVGGCLFQNCKCGVAAFLGSFNRTLAYVDSSTFFDVDSGVVGYAGASGRISRNRIENDTAAVGINLFDWNDNDTIYIVSNTIRGFYTGAHLRFNNLLAVVADNIIVTGEGTPRSSTAIDGFNSKPTLDALPLIKFRRNKILGFASFGFSIQHGDPGDPAPSIDLGDMSLGDPGLNTIVTPVAGAKAINNFGPISLKAQGNWFGTANPPSSLFSGSVDASQPLTAPRDSASGKVGVYGLTSITWGPGKATIQGDVTVDSGTTWKVVPACTLSFVANTDVKKSGVDTTKAEVIVKGTLDARGNVPDSVRFRSQSGSPGTQDWFGIRVLSGGQAKIVNSVIRDAYYGFWDNGTQADTLANSTVSRCDASGVYAQNSNLAILRNRFDGTEMSSLIPGVFIYKKSPLVRGNTFLNLGFAVWAESSASVIDTNRFTRTSPGAGLLSLRGLNKSNLLVRGCVFTDPAQNSISVNQSTVTVQACSLAGQAITAVAAENGSTLNIRKSRLANYSAYGLHTNYQSQGDAGKVSNPGENFFGEATPVDSLVYYIAHDNPAQYDTFFAQKDTFCSTQQLAGFRGLIAKVPSVFCFFGGRIATPQLQDAQTPPVFSLSQNQPNPFNPATRIQFTLPEAGHVELVIYNILGQKVKTIAGGQMPVGEYSVIWDGTDYFGREVPSGVYFYRLTAGEMTESKKMTLVR